MDFALESQRKLVVQFYGVVASRAAPRLPFKQSASGLFLICSINTYYHLVNATIKRIMLSNENRFHGPNSLRFVYRNGKTVHSHVCKIKYTPNPRRKDSRFAIVISKKVHKSAVGRNRIRRRFYEVIRDQIPSMKPGFDVVIIVVSGEALGLPFESIRETLGQLFKEADLYE